MACAGGGDAFADLRIGIHGIKCGLAFRSIFGRHREDISIYDGALAGKFFIEAGNADQVVEFREFAAIPRRILRLIGSDAVDHLGGGCLVAGADHRSPGDGADADEEANDRDDDHQFDKVKAVLRTGAVFEMHIFLAEHSAVYHEIMPLKFQKFSSFSRRFANNLYAPAKVSTSNFDAFGIKLRVNFVQTYSRLF